MDGNKILRGISEIRETLDLKKNISIIKEVINEPSLYKEFPRKSKAKRIAENILWYIVNFEPCRYYNSYGFDVVGLRNQKEYMPYRKFRIERNNQNYYTSPYHVHENMTCVLRDKVLFSAYFGKVLGAKYVIKDYGIIKPNGMVLNLEANQEESFSKFINQHQIDLFVKKLSGECGDGCYVIKPEEDNFNINDVIGAEYVVQEKLQQHSDLDKLNSSCINTIRIITVIGENDKKPHIFAHFLRLGVGAINDNRATGGIGILIYEDGTLAEVGIGHHCLVYSHPITNETFKGVKIPYWNQVEELVIKAHSFLPGIKSIGWDVAVTPSGRVLLEGNDNWEICGPQDTAGGLKKKWNNIKKL